MSSFRPLLFTVLSLAASTIFFGDESAGTNAGTLDAALKNVNGSGGTIIFGIGGVTLDNQVRAVQSDGTFTFVPGITITIEGMKQNLDGSGGKGNNRGLFVGGRNASLKDTGSVHINNLYFVNCAANGGDGGKGAGGGGLGAGGGLFVGENTNVLLQNCTFSYCLAKGGNGTTFTNSGFCGGGGGGMRGNGGDFSHIEGEPTSFGGGGGFGGNGAAGDISSSVCGGGGGACGFPEGNAMGAAAGKDFDKLGSSGDPGVGGDGGDAIVDGGSGGFGGGGGGGSGFGGGAGGFGGGGGSGSTNGSSGKFGGGGGAAGGLGGAGGAGGFGGGGGGTNGNAAHIGTGGFGGGNANENFGGKGAGFGGAIFIQSKGNLTIETTSSFADTMFTNNSAAAADSGNANTNPTAGFGALGQDIFMMSEGSLTFDLATSVSMPSPIQGNIGSEGEDQAAGGLTKKGSSLLTLTDDNTYTGKTTIEAGELRINGSVISEIEVKEGATLSGNSTAKKIIGNPNSGNLTNAGTVSPGTNGVGTINIEGNYVQTNKGKLVIDITPTGDISDKVLGATSADLDGTLELVLNPGNYIAGTIYLITNAPTNGQFQNIQKTGSVADAINVKLTYSSVFVTILDSRIFEDQNINPGIPQDVADCITTATITPGSDFATMVEVLGTLSDSQVNKALTSLSAVQFGALEWINARNNSYAADLLSHHLFELCRHQKSCGPRVWTTAFGNLMQNKKQIGNLPRFDANASGVLLGIDFSSQSYLSYGAAFGYTYTDFLWKKKGGKGDIRSYYGALYSGWSYACLSGDLSLLVGSSDNSTKRDISFAAVNRTAKGDFGSHFVTTHVGFKAELNLCGNVLEPFFLADYHYYTHRNFTETGADSLNLTVQSKDQHMMRVESGFKWSHEVDYKRYSFAPYLGLSLVEEFPLGKSKQPASFKNQPCVMDALCYDSNAQFVAPQLGVRWCHCKGTSFLLGYKGLYNDKIHINEVEGRLEWVF